MSVKDDKTRSNGALKCCKSNDSLVSVSSDENEIFCDPKTVCVTQQKNSKLKFNNNWPDHHFTFPKRQHVEIEFNDLKYSASEWCPQTYRLHTKNILHGVSGKFSSGELSVIMGPSGAGKSTLLNILAGFITRGSTGEIKLNGVVRDHSPRFRKLSAYIPQEEELRLALTVKESMTFAANLKLGYSVSHQYKAQQVVEILELLGLDQCYNTSVARLSGGQRKRLAVALELLSNPPILFLDEPTTGLDSSSCSQCMHLFKSLAKEGRTIVCTIHQPSALLFETFDKLYAVAAGKCIYEGEAGNLVPYLESFGLKCPSYHNPADFLIEVAIGEYEANLDALAESAIINHEKSQITITKEHEILFSEKRRQLFVNDECSNHPAPVIMQFLLLYKRNLLIARRNYMYCVNRLLAHIAIGFIFGYLYKGVGANANQILGNYVYLYGSVLLNVYTGKMAVTLSFPLEMRILKQEHFNRWYKLTPYLLSVIFIEIPFQVMCTCMYILISYWLTDQPLDFRVYLFVLFCTVGSLCAQSMGYFIGATLPTKIAVFTGPVIACMLSVFGFCIRYYDTPVICRWAFKISYFRAIFQSMVYSIYGMNRGPLRCPDEEEYCHYTDPAKFLKEMDIMDVSLVSNFTMLVFTWFLMHAATYLVLWLKLHKR